MRHPSARPGIRAAARCSIIGRSIWHGRKAVVRRGVIAAVAFGGQLLAQQHDRPPSAREDRTDAAPGRSGGRGPGRRRRRQRVRAQGRRARLAQRLPQGPIRHLRAVHRPDRAAAESRGGAALRARDAPHGRAGAETGPAAGRRRLRDLRRSRRSSRSISPAAAASRCGLRAAFRWRQGSTTSRSWSGSASAPPTVAGPG